MTTAELQKALTHIGFTEYEAKIYLALLRENPATGYQISKKSGVPRSMVYEALGRLQARGAVMETIDSRASHYRPLPPDILLDKQEEERKRLFDRLRPALLGLYSAPKGERTWSITGRGTVLTYAAQMIRRAKDEIFLVLNDDDLEALYDDVAQAYDRGVSVSTLLTGEKELNVGTFLRHPPLESELQGLTNTLLVVVDDEEGLVASTNQDTKATITSNTDLVLIARQFVWMEMFTQRIYARLGPDLLARLEPEDRRIFESLITIET
jgi:Cd2+/Zn2+-exporting ATPase